MGVRSDRNEVGPQLARATNMRILSPVRGPPRTTPFVIQLPRRFPDAHARSRQYLTEPTAALLQHKETLIREVHHRVANSLQIIASILAMDARKVHSGEARLHLENAHRRILAVATVQHQLQTAREGGELELAAYLRQLCENLTASVVGDATRIAIEVRADVGMVASAAATDIGLIVTELVINALKHAFMADATTGKILVSYRVETRGWRLTVSDNGVGKPAVDPNPAATGLGTGIIAVLARQLGAHIETSTGPNGLGTAVSVTSGLASPSRGPDVVNRDAGSALGDPSGEISSER